MSRHCYDSCDNADGIRPDTSDHWTMAADEELEEDLDSTGHWVLGRGFCALLAWPPVDYSHYYWDKICRIKCEAL